MTKEAKVGLLLGLVFIVAIAVVLRGVHKTGVGGSDETSHLAIKNHVADSSDDESVSPAVKNLQLRQKRTYGNGRYGQSQRVRLPRRGFDSNGRSTSRRNVGDAALTVARHTQANSGGVSVSVAAEGDVAGGAKVVAADDIRYEQMLPGRGDSGADSGAIMGIGIRHSGNSTVTSVRASGSVYVVADGDNLSKIALAVYGSEAGRKWANVMRIYQANKGRLKSMDDLWAGQRLVIPVLAQANSDKTAPLRISIAPKVSQAGRVYVVRENDSLWKIAERELGSGSRYVEIAKLNSDVITDENNLWPGVSLRLP